MVRDVARIFAGRAAVVQVNIDESPETASRYGIRGVPALVLIRNGSVVESTSGALSLQALIAWLNRALAR